MTLRKLSLALATMIAALATTSSFDGASAREQGLVAVVSDAPENLRAKRRDLVFHGRFGAVSRPLTRDITGRAMRGGGRINGRMSRR